VHLVVADDSSKTAREQEMAKTVKALQDSLNKTTTELERIKKRLSTGTGKP
jgi:gas vesicle protein